MSTKIYDAYKLKNGIKKDLLGLISIVQEIKADTERTAEEEVAEILARKVQFVKDLHTYYGKNVSDIISSMSEDEDEKEYLDTTIRNLKEDRINIAFMDTYNHYEKAITSEPFLKWHSYASITLIPCGKRVFAMLFGNTSYVTGMDKYFVDYHYQNQTDRPNEISAAEWRRREKDWDIALGEDFIPANHGLTFQLFDISDTHFEFQLLRNRDLLKKSLKKAEQDQKTRIHMIFETLENPFFTKNMNYIDILEISGSAEYKKWKKRAESKIKVRLKKAD